MTRWMQGTLLSRAMLLASRGALLFFATALTVAPASALSEIQREELPAPLPGNGPPKAPTGDQAVPLPGPVEDLPPAEGTPEDAPAETEEPAESTGPDPAEPLPEVITNLDRLPEPTRRMYNLILEACRSGELEALRPLLGSGEGATQLSLGGSDGDPVEFLKSLAGDSEGQEILAIMEEVLSAGFVHLDAGTPQELYVWPYFFAYPLDKLDAKQRVELFKIVTAGDYEEMKTFGNYIFYRVGISPKGEWAFFVAGE